MAFRGDWPLTRLEVSLKSLIKVVCKRGERYCIGMEIPTEEFTAVVELKPEIASSLTEFRDIFK